MPVREILSYPDKRLRQKSQPVKDFGPNLQMLVDDMFATMKSAEGIGLAAIQIGIALRITVIDIDEPLVVINPTLEVIDHTLNTQEEGCLSLPGVRADIARPSYISVEAYDRHGKPFSVKADGLLAVCLQHEIDHMNGMLFIDKLSPLKKSQINSQLRNLIALHENKGAP